MCFPLFHHLSQEICKEYRMDNYLVKIALTGFVRSIHMSYPLLRWSILPVEGGWKSARKLVMIIFEVYRTSISY